MYRQEDKETRQQENLIRKNKVLDSKSIIHVCSNLNNVYSTNLEKNLNRIT